MEPNGAQAPTRRRTARRRGVVLAVLVAVTAVLGGVLATVFGALHERSVRSHDQVAGALAVARDLRVVDGLEWRAVAGQDIEGMRSALAAAEERIALGIARLGGDPEPLRAAAARYTRAVERMLTELEDGDRATALEIDETVVDPAFDATFEMLSGIVERESEEARRTDRQVSTLIWLISIGAVGLLGVAAAVAVEVRRRRTEDAQRAAHEQRLRSLIERSTDVITVVTGTDDLTIVSPDIGALRDVASTPSPRRVRDLLPAACYRTWREVDAVLRRSVRPHDVDLTLQREDGSPLHLEAYGAPLDTGSGERVWTWRDVTERKELEVELAHQAFHDSLTGVANRALMLERMGQALRTAARSGAQLTALFCDLDNFKAVNDALGHGAGDALLRVVAERLQSAVRDADTVARLGGDEFAVLTESDATYATALAERLRSVVGREVELDGHVVVPSMSVGIATGGPATTPEQLLQSADLAMYAAKQAGKGQLSVFHEGMHVSALAAVELQEDLKRAVQDEQLVLHYQPIVDLASHEVYGVEALVRWQHPELGLLPPDRFIPLAEATGRILGIGRWVLRTACEAAVALEADGSRPYMSVNLSPQQLHSPTIVGVVEEALERSGLLPGRLQLEVTEGQLLDDSVAIERLQQLRAIGVRIAVDDFGTGYASVHYLQTLPIDVLKIDRSFVSGGAITGTQRTAFLQAIAGLAQALHLQLVAEGVETAEQYEVLHRLGCRSGQGWLWSRAHPVEQLRPVIRSVEQGRPAGSTAGV